MIIGIGLYILIGLWIARATTEFINQKNIANNVLIAGEPATWTSNFWIWLGVVVTPLIWVLMPAIILLSVVAKQLNRAAVYVGKELSNPKNNVKEIENEEFWKEGF